MNPAALLACNSMHLPWWVGPAVIYLLVGWVVGAVLTVANLCRLLDVTGTPTSKIVNVAHWALYAVAIIYVAAIMCRIASPPHLSLPDPLSNYLWVYGFLVPSLAVWHTVFFAKNRLPASEIKDPVV